MESDSDLMKSVLIKQLAGVCIMKFVVLTSSSTTEQGRAVIGRWNPREKKRKLLSTQYDLFDLLTGRQFCQCFMLL